jgi:isopenicillin N synthase-like dioxygenase
MTAIPIVDLTAAREGSLAERSRVARAIDAACCDIGFFTITGHGVPNQVIADLRAAAHAFFALPLARKLEARHPVAGTNRGYHPVGGETLSASLDEPAPADLKEFFHIGPVDVTGAPYYMGEVGRRHFVPNNWPVVPREFEHTATVYYRTMSRLIVMLMRLTAVALGLDERFFDGKIDRSIGTMRLNYYPVQSEPPRAGQLRASAHTDYGGFTVLSGEDVPGGLQVRTRTGEWVDVRTEPQSLVVNIGDLLMRWTNDRWLSNLHRVVNPPSGGAASIPRLSIAFFSHPNYDVLIECIAAPGQARHPPVMSGDYRDLKYTKTGLAPAKVGAPGPILAEP